MKFSQTLFLDNKYQIFKKTEKLLVFWESEFTLLTEHISNVAKRLKEKKCN